MAEGTRDYRWEYEECIYMDDRSHDTAMTWALILAGNEDYIMGEVEVGVFKDLFVRLRYSWKSKTLAWIKTDGKYYGMAVRPRNQPALMIYPVAGEDGVMDAMR